MTPVEWTLIGGSMVYSVVEYWLGKTDKVEAGSAIEAAMNGLKIVTKIFLRK